MRNFVTTHLRRAAPLPITSAPRLPRTPHSAVSSRAISLASVSSWTCRSRLRVYLF
ncbi:MAG: hypothetical protein ACLTYW_05785 [Collinsella sp.]